MCAALAESDPVSESATLAVHDTVTAACDPYRTSWRLTGGPAPGRDTVTAACDRDPYRTRWRLKAACF
jgi:hypothetical protein